MKKFVWIDCETSGLNPETNQLLEVSIVITDSNLKELDYMTRVIKNDKINIDEFCYNLHSKNGLLKDIEFQGVSLKEAEQDIFWFLTQTLENGTSPMCGSTIQFDRKFLEKYMPSLNKFFHYRNLDVSSVKILWSEFLGNAHFPKGEAHRGLPDVRESIDHFKQIKTKIEDKKKYTYVKSSN